MINIYFLIRWNLNKKLNFKGSNWINQTYLVQPTTYDYDAPLSEAGDITEKFMAIREAVSQYLPLPKISIPANSKKVGYGKVPMSYVINFPF